MGGTCRKEKKISGDAKLNNGFGAWGRRCAERFPYSILSGVVKWRLAFLAVFYLYDVILAL